MKCEVIPCKRVATRMHVVNGVETWFGCFWCSQDRKQPEDEILVLNHFEDELQSRALHC